MPMIGLIPAAIACRWKSYAPKRLPWSVMARAGMPSRRGFGEEVGEPGRAVEHRVLGVHVQVHEGVGHPRPPFRPPRPPRRNRAPPTSGPARTGGVPTCGSPTSGRRSRSLALATDAGQGRHSNARSPTSGAPRPLGFATNSHRPDTVGAVSGTHLGDRGRADANRSRSATGATDRWSGAFLPAGARSHPWRDGHGRSESPGPERVVPGPIGRGPAALPAAAHRRRSGAPARLSTGRRPAPRQAGPARRPAVGPARIGRAGRWYVAELVTSIGCAALFLSWSRTVDVDPLDRRGQVGGLATLQFRFAVIAAVLVVALLLAHRYAGVAGRERAVALGCAAIAGLTTGLVAGGIDVALRGTQWGLWAGGGDYDWIRSWIERMRRGESVPAHYPPAILYLIWGWSRISDQPLAYAIKEIQLVGTALFGPAAYLAWRTTLRPVWALGIGVVAMLPFIEPVKPYPQLTLVMLMPVLVWFLRTVRRGAGRPTGRAIGLGAGFGVGIGLLFLLYSGWFVWCAPGALLAFALLAPWRTGRRPTLATAATALVTFLAVTWVHLRGLLAPTGGTSDAYFYFDTSTEPAYLAMWRNDRPADVGGVWPPLGELGGVGLFTIVLAVGLGVAIWLGWRRTAVVTVGLSAASAWFLRMWLAGGQWATQTVRLYPRTTMVLLYCLLILTGLAVRYAVTAARDRLARQHLERTPPADRTAPGERTAPHDEAAPGGWVAPGESAAPGRWLVPAGPPRRSAPTALLLIPLLLVLASAGSATADRYMPVSRRDHTGYFAWIAQTKRLIGGGCSKYGRLHGCGTPNPPAVPSNSAGRPATPVNPTARRPARHRRQRRRRRLPGPAGRRPGGPPRADPRPHRRCPDRRAPATPPNPGGAGAPLFVRRDPANARRDPVPLCGRVSGRTVRSSRGRPVPRIAGLGLQAGRTRSRNRSPAPGRTAPRRPPGYGWRSAGPGRRAAASGPASGRTAG